MRKDMFLHLTDKTNIDFFILFVLELVSVLMSSSNVIRPWIFRDEGSPQLCNRELETHIHTHTVHICTFAVKPITSVKGWEAL